jgi:hypothetical protein
MKGKLPMSILLEANYCKKLGLPGYSSHQFSITVRTEIEDATQVQAESARLYALLQGSVDREIQQSGYVPLAEPNGTSQGQPPHRNGTANGNGQHSRNDRWNCSDKQRGLIERIVEENRLDKNNVEQLAQDRFGKSVKNLNRLEASGLIEELLHQTNPNGTRRFQKAHAR